MARSITSGAVSGVVAGIAVSMILGIYHSTDNYLQRQKQIRYISQVVSDASRIIQEEGNPQTKLLYLNRLLRRVDRFLESTEASEISYSEKESLRGVLPYRITGEVEYKSQPPNNPDHDKFFRTAISQFEGVLWLQLEENIDNE